MTLPVRRSYAGAAPACTLSSDINASATSFSLTGTTTNWPATANGPFYMVIDPGLSTEEKVLVAARTSGALSSVTRGVDGTTGAAHAAGATCYPVFTAVDANEANDLASTLTTKGDLLSTDGSDPTRVGVGTNGQLLVADSAETSGIKWSNTISAATVISGSTAGELLRITQTGAGAALLVEDSTNPDSTPFVVDSGGQLIVGATSLSITSTSVTPRVQIAGTSNDACSFIIYNFANDTTTTATTWAKSRGGSFGTQGAVVSGDSIGVLNFEGSDGTQLRRAVQIIAGVDGTVSSAIVPGRLTFSTMNTSGTLTERMRIDSSGQVGIGGTPAAGRVLAVSKTLTGSTTSTGISYFGTIQSDVTSNAYLFYTIAATQAASFTVTSLHHFRADQGTFGATSAVTTQVGFSAGSSLTGATNNYGFYGTIASGSGRYNLYMSGTADNYLAGRLGVGATLTSGAMAQVTNTTAADKVLVVKGAASQSGNYFEVQNSAGTVQLTMDTSANVLFGGMTTIATSSAKTLHIANGTAPTANPTGGGVLYVESGALKYRGSSGTITTIANA